MENIIWNIPCERALDRIDELTTYIEHFPESPLVPVFRREVEALEESVRLL